MTIWQRLFARKRLDQDLREEMESHLAMARRDRLDRGEPERDAEHNIRREFGNELLIQETTRDMWGGGAIEAFAQDLKYALRQMHRSPGFTTIAIATLALGLGATTAIFSIVNSVLLQPLRYREPGRLYLVQNIPPPSAAADNNWPVNSRHYHEWRTHCRTCEDIALIDGFGFTLTGEGEPVRLMGLSVSYNLFRTLGVRPALGRDFLPSEEAPNAAAVVIISDGLWRARFAADPNIIGRKLTLNGRTKEVVGVLPADFTIPKGAEWGVGFPSDLPPLLFQPLHFAPARAEPVGMDNYVSIVRLRPGVQPSETVAELQMAIADFVRERKIQERPTLVPMQDTVVRKARTGLWLLLGTVGAVLLIVCVNIGNLMLVRTTGRIREAGVRLALGATRRRIFSMVLSEAIVLVVAGGVLGLLVANFAVDAFRAGAPIDLPRLDEVRIDWRVLSFAASAMALSAFLSAWLPAWKLSRTEPNESLKSGSRSTDTAGRARLREALVGVEVALSTVLLIIGGLMLVSLARVLNVDKGVEVAHVIIQDISLVSPKYRDDPERNGFIGEALRKLSELPQVEAAGVTTKLPLKGNGWIDGLNDASIPEKQRFGDSPLANFRFVSPGFDKAMGIRLIEGRFFEEIDRNRPVAVISERAAGLLWPGRTAVGRSVLSSGSQRRAVEVVGVVRGVRASIEKDPPVTVYLPYWDQGPGGVSIAVRIRGDETDAIRAVQATLRSMDAEMPLMQAKTMEQLVGDSVAVRRFETSLAASFASSALLLALLGIYGVVAFTVARRTPELGVRIALGARPGQLIAMVVRQGMRPVVIGLVAGLGAAIGVSRFIASELYGITPRDPVAFAAVAALLTAVAAAACWIPARRATGIDPLRALRFE
jgi:predicted permease